MRAEIGFRGRVPFSKVRFFAVFAGQFYFLRLGNSPTFPGTTLDIPIRVGFGEHLAAHDALNRTF